MRNHSKSSSEFQYLHTLPSQIILHPSQNQHDATYTTSIYHRHSLPSNHLHPSNPTLHHLPNNIHRLRTENRAPPYQPTNLNPQFPPNPCYTSLPTTPIHQTQHHQHLLPTLLNPFLYLLSHTPIRSEGNDRLMGDGQSDCLDGQLSELFRGVLGYGAT